jgi:hypothetical protein
LHIVNSSILLAALSFSLLQAAEVRLTVIDNATGQPVPGRIHLRDASGAAQRPAGVVSWNDHFVCEWDRAGGIACGPVFFHGGTRS